MAESEDTGTSSPTQFPFDMNTLQEEMLLCPICQFRIEDPKDLECQHSFCKCCLDELLVFNDDGSAQIHCPMRCPLKTTLNPKETTNNLKTSYTLKSILEWFQLQEGQSMGTKRAMCEGQADCQREISTHCISCTKTLCIQCSKEQCLASPGSLESATYSNNPVRVHKSLPVRYDTRTCALEAICEVHDTYARHVCCKDQLICVYCKNRTHHGHENQESVADICKRIHTSISTLQPHEAPIQPSLDVTVKALSELRKEVTTALQKQALRKFRSFMQKIESERSECLQELTAFEQHHIKKQSDVLSLKTQRTLVVPDFQLALEEHSALSGSDESGQSASVDYKRSDDLNFASTILPRSTFRLNIDSTNVCDVRSNMTSSTTTVFNDEEETEPDDISRELSSIYIRVCELLERDDESEESEDQYTDGCSEDAQVYPSAPSLPSSLTHQQHLLSIKRGKKGFGFTIDQCDRGWEVKYVRDDKRCAGLLPGDVITSINGINVRHKEFEEVVEILKNCSLQKNTDFCVER